MSMNNEDQILPAGLENAVARIAPDKETQKDLQQEALIHLWKMKLKRPGQTPSWYLKSAVNRLRDCLKRGRSVDSPCGRHRGARVDVESEALESQPSSPVVDDSFQERLVARDLIEKLSSLLSPLERAILAQRVNGFGVREIARKMGLPHQSVSDYRKNLANAPKRLGFSPPPPPSLRR